MMRKTACVLLSALLLTGCGGRKTYDEIPKPAAEKSTLTPVGNWDSGNNYENVPAVTEQTKETVSSADGLCKIEVKEHYLDITLDLTGGDHFAAGAAYAEALCRVNPDFEKITENYLYDCMKMVYSDHAALNQTGYDSKEALLADRVRTMQASLPEAYQEELKGFASKFSAKNAGLVKDGTLSQEECSLISLVPDVMRETACSGMIVNPERAASGKRMTARIMEWDLGSGNSMTEGHCVLRFKNGEKSVISVGSIGQLDVLTGMNDDGVFGAILDVGSYEDFGDCKGRLSYTFSMREGLENCKTAKEFGEFMTGRAERFTFNHNVIITDEKDGFIAEDNHLKKEGKPLLRDEKTPLLDNLSWNAEGCICVVNAFAGKGQPDGMTTVSGNIVRWMKYDRLFAGTEKITLPRFKSLMTAEKTDTAFSAIRSNNVVFMLIADYDTRTLQAVFTGKTGVAQTPDFISLGTF